MPYQVTAQLAVLKDRAGKEHYVYGGSLVPEGIEPDELDRLARVGLIAEIGDDGSLKPPPQDLPNVTQSDLHRRRSTGAEPIGGINALIDQLRREGVEPPAEAGRALELAEEFEQITIRPDLAGWIAAADLDQLSGQQILDQVRTTLTDTGLISGSVGPGIVAGVRQTLGVRAAGAVVADLDRIFDELRPAWDEAAKRVREATLAGLTGSTTAIQAINAGDEAVAAWRSLAAPTAALDRLHKLRNQLLYLANREIPERDLGTVNWLDRATAGPPELTITGLTRQAAQLAQREALHRSTDSTDHEIEEEVPA